VLNGPSSGSRFLLDQDITQAGRHPDADIFLDDVTVSRRHAEIKRSPAGFEVRDLGSMNGTYVGGKSVTSQLLQDGEEIQIGKFRLTYFSGSNGSDL
jgi:pSer/pThr/pTyr-binding forkhead associated (FHA) protein